MVCGSRLSGDGTTTGVDGGVKLWATVEMPVLPAMLLAGGRLGGDDGIGGMMGRTGTFWLPGHSVATASLRLTSLVVVLTHQVGHRYTQEIVEDFRAGYAEGALLSGDLFEIVHGQIGAAVGDPDCLVIGIGIHDHAGADQHLAIGRLDGLKLKRRQPECPRQP